MREIKFRVWDELLSEMFYEGFTLTENGMVRKCGWYLQREAERRHRQDAAMAANNGKYVEPKYPQGFIVLQFTGLKDKNGKEIYEGDIIKNLIGTAGEIVFSQTINGYFTGFGVQYKGTKSHWGINPLECEVIGNIHENPELLGESKK